MKIRAYIHECLEKLQQLGICATEEEEKYAEMILGMPEEILENMEPGQITGMLLGAAGQLSQGGEGTTGVYAFDTELPDPSQMGTEFLQVSPEYPEESWRLRILRKRIPWMCSKKGREPGR